MLSALDGSEAMRDPSAWINQYIKDIAETESLLAEEGILLTKSEIYNYLIEALDLENLSKILYTELPASRMVSLVREQYKRSPPPEVLGEVEFKESILPSGVPRFLIEQQVKIKGEKWVIHKNDADPFPSNPHAHNYQDNLVVHLGNGELYQRRRKVGKLKKKKLEFLRSKIRNVSLPKLSV